MSEASKAIVEGAVFSFSPPSGWEVVRGADGVVYAGPTGGVLRISASRMLGEGADDEAAGIVEQLRENGLNSIRMALEEPGAVVEAPLARVPGESERWEMLLLCDAGRTLFYQALFVAPGGVLLATLECESGPKTRNVIREFAESVTVSK